LARAEANHEKLKASVVASQKRIEAISMEWEAYPFVCTSVRR
jgi:hypothetical protein